MDALIAITLPPHLDLGEVHLRLRIDLGPVLVDRVDIKRRLPLPKKYGLRVCTIWLVEHHVDECLVAVSFDLSLRGLVIPRRRKLLFSLAQRRQPQVLPDAFDLLLLGCVQLVHDARLLAQALDLLFELLQLIGKRPVRLLELVHGLVCRLQSPAIVQPNLRDRLLELLDLGRSIGLRLVDLALHRADVV